MTTPNFTDAAPQPFAEYPRLALPEYKSMLKANWALKKVTRICPPGYWRATDAGERSEWTLTRRVQGSRPRVWKSLTTADIEAYGPHVDASYRLAGQFGVVVLVGLGLGFMVHNLGIHPDIRKIIVFEEDAKLIKAWREFTGGEQRFFDKDRVQIYNEPFSVGRTHEPIDYLFTEKGGAKSMRALLVNHQDKVKRCGWLRQELDIMRFSMRETMPVKPATTTDPTIIDRLDIERYAEAQEVPIYGADNLDYARRVTMAGRVNWALI